VFVALYAYLAFLSIALPDSTLGVAWPAMSITFGVPLGAAGLIPPVGVAATLVSTLATRHAVARLGIGRLLVVSTCLSAAGLAVAAASPTLATFLVGVVLTGLSGGAIDVALNAYAASQFGQRQVSLMHASYVVGAAASPVLVTVSLQVGAGWQLPYAIIAGLQLVLAIVFASGVSQWKQSGAGLQTKPSTRTGRSGGLTVTAGVGIAAVVLQTAIESSIALWAFSFLTLAADVPQTVAGLTVSGFWLTMFASRVAVGTAAERIGTWTVIGLSAIGLVAAGALTAAGTLVPTAAVAGVLLFGLTAGPVYPLLVLTTRERTTPDGIERLVALQSAASSVGAASLPALVGLAMTASPATYAVVLPAAAVVAALLLLTLRVMRRQPG